MMQQVKGYLRLMRPANIVTAISDILAGIAIAVYFIGMQPGDIQMLHAFLLVLATIGLYGGGVVFNDVFDAALDKVERPERPIPSGLIQKKKSSHFRCCFIDRWYCSGSICSSAIRPIRLHCAGYSHCGTGV